VNPAATTTLGHPAFPSLDALPETPDPVDVFRKPADLPQVLEESIAAGARTFWLHLGLSDVSVARHGEEAGLRVVMNRCVKIEHARFNGGLHLAGFNTGVRLPSTTRLTRELRRSPTIRSGLA